MSTELSDPTTTTTPATATTTTPRRLERMNAWERRAVGWGAAVTFAGVVPVMWQSPLLGFLLPPVGAAMIGWAWASRYVRAEKPEGRARILHGFQVFAAAAFLTLVIAAAVFFANVSIWMHLHDLAKHRD